MAGFERNLNIAGDWKGSYAYDLEAQRHPDGSGVGFELHLHQSWWQGFFGRFSGRVTDNPERGMPGVGRIRGSLRGATIRFTKRMPVAYSVFEGRSISIRDWLRKHGYDIGYDIAHPSVSYHGTFSSADTASGTWRIAAGHIHVTSRLSIPIPDCTGTWTLNRPE